MLSAGDSAKAAAIAADIYSHTIDIIQAATAMSGYQALSPEQIFDVEYWELEQAKLAKESSRKPLAGEVAFVTGAASGIGRACAAALLDAGAVVVGIDLSECVKDTFSGPSWLGIPTDVTSREALEAAIEKTVRTFGGLDILVPAAGIFAASAPIAELDVASWDKSMAVNTDALFTLFQLAHPLLKLAPERGRVVLIASKNVHAPGPGASAYSASKAAASQLARVAALEWASDGIRVNMVNPDAVFDTALWTPALLAERAAKYGMTVEDYKKRNLLRTEVTSSKVGQVVTDLCLAQYSATTGAQVPIDGGNERVI
jgi:NAD(P)-dependent dehydrogenase (short-subunit alcohol dehydrogenase family)